MRKYFLSFVALAAGLFATSCQESLVEPQIAGPTTFTVQLPDAMGTKAFGDASAVKQLLVEVYPQNGESVIYQTVEQGNGQFEVSLNLIQDQAYDILFWAQTANGYVVVSGNETDGYSFGSLRNVPMNSNYLNNDNGAAFFHAEKGFVPNGTSTTITLVRPFAQLNLGTTPASLKTDAGEYELVSSAITVTGMANSFNVFSGEGFGDAVATYNFTSKPVPNEDLTIGTTPNTTTYDYVSMNYLSVLGNEKALVDIDATIVVTNGTEVKTINHSFTSVPVQENYRTNIVGNLISSTTDFNVVVDAAFAKDENGQLYPDNDYFVVDNVADAVTAYANRKTHVAINYIVNRGKIDIPNTAKETLYLQLPDVDAEFTVNVPQEVKKLNIAVPNTDESNVGLNLIVNAPNSTVDFTGQAAMIISTTASNTLNLNGAEVGKIIVKKGNVVIENQSQVEVLDNQSGGQVTVYVDNTSDVEVPDNDNFEKIEEPEIIDTYEALQNALTYSSDVVLTNDITLSEILVIQRRDFIFDGNGYTLKSTAGRAINVSGADGVTIKNLTINCSGERAINIIQNATNVTIDNVTATAANYTVNVAGSAPNAFVDIKNSTLNGLCTVNVAGEEAEVYVNNSTVNCNDNNTAEGEAYAALSLNKDAVKGKIIASETEVNVTEGSDSKKGRNGAEDGEVLINGSTEGVVVMVAAITYPGSDYYYSFASLNEAFEFAQKENRPVTLIRNITVEEPIVIEEGQTVVLDLNGKTITGTMPKSVGAVVKNNGTLTIQNGTISSTAANGGSPIGNYGTLNVKNATINGASVRENGGWPSYPVNNYSNATFEKVVVNGYQGAIACNAAGTTTLTECTINKEYLNTSSHVFYINHADAKVVVNSGTYTHKGMDGSLAYVAKGKITVNGGTFSASDGGYGMAPLSEGSIEVNGGNFSAAIQDWGGTIEITGGTFPLKPNDAHLADGYKAVKNADGKWEVVAKTYVAQIGDEKYESLNEAVAAVQDDQTITFLSDVEQADGVILTDKNITVDLNGKTFTVSEGASTNNRNFKINGSSIVTIKNGTMIAAGELTSGAYGTLRTEGTAYVTLEDVKLYNYRGNGLNVKALSGTTVTITNTEIYSVYGGGVESAGGIIELTDVKVEQKGMYTAPYNSMTISVNGGGQVTVNSGTYSTECITAEEANNQGSSHGPWCAGVLNSGGTLIIKGGTFSNDNYGENSLANAARGLLLADTGANIQIEGGTFNAVKAIIDIQNNLGDASKNPKALLNGGDYSSNPLTWEGLISLGEGKTIKEQNNRWIIQ